jgi:hypothetical protein
MESEPFFNHIHYPNMPKLRKIIINGVSCNIPYNLIRLDPAFEVVVAPSPALQRHMVRLHCFWQIKACVYLCMTSRGLVKDVARLIARDYIHWSDYIVPFKIKLPEGHIQVNPKHYTNLKRLRDEYEKEKRNKKSKDDDTMVNVRRRGISNYLATATGQPGLAVKFWS